MNITVAGVGYVGLAQAVLLAQHNAVTAVTTTPAKAEQINRGVHGRRGHHRHADGL